MAEIISIDNFPDFNILDVTELTADVVAGATSLPIENEDGFDANHAILVGDPGSEGSEIIRPDSISDESIAYASGIDMAHKKGTRVYKLYADQFRVYRASNVDGTVPSVGSFSLLTTQSMEADQLETEYEDSSGSSSYWYLYTLYNDIPGTPEESDKDTTTALRGGGTNLYVAVEDVRETAGLTNNRWITDARIYRKLIQSQSEVNGALIKGGYTLPLDTVPEMVKNATELLAAGYVLSTGDWQSTSVDGEKKIEQARKLLMKIESGELQLVDETGAALASSTGVAGYPDNTTVDEYDYDNYTPRMFTADMKL